VSKTAYKVLIVPWHLIGKKATCEHLRRYAEGGGTLILETAFGLFDERCFCNPEVPPYGLSEVFGYREKESYYFQPKGERGPLADILGAAVLPQAEQIYDEPEIQFSEPLSIRVKARTFVTPIDITSATAIATCQSFTVAAKKQVGKGQIFYIGTNLGASIAAGDEAGVELLRAILTPIVRPRVSSKTLRPRLIASAKRSLRVVINDTPRDETEGISHPAEYARANDIHSGKELRLENQRIQLTVPYEDAVVVQLDM
jgi:hypothetical protein